MCVLRLYPCGLIARSVFKDKFFLSVRNSTTIVSTLGNNTIAMLVRSSSECSEVDQNPERVNPKPQVATKNPEKADLVQGSDFYRWCGLYDYRCRVHFIRTHNFWLLEEFPPQVCVPADSSTVPIPTRVARTYGCMDAYWCCLLTSL